MSIARTRTVVGSLYALMRNALGLNVATPLEPQELSCTVAPDRRLVVLGHEPIAGFARAHGTVADEAAMLALHTLDSATLLTEPTFVAPGDSCLRADDPGWRWHCITGHGQALADWERRPLGGALEGLATSGHTHAIAAVTGLQSALDAFDSAVDAAATTANAAAPLASPALTGEPTAPTPSAGTNSTRIATTAFVAAAIASAGGSGGGPFVGARVRRVGRQTVSGPTAVIWTNEDDDTDSMWVSSDPSRITVRIAGRYLLQTSLVRYSGTNYVYFRRNGTSLHGTFGPWTMGSSGYIAALAVLSLAADDYIECVVEGGDVTSGSTDESAMTVTRLG